MHSVNDPPPGSAEDPRELRRQISELGAERDALRLERDALARACRHYRDLYEKAPLGYQSLDDEGRFLEVNDAWLSALGYAREEVLGRWFGSFLAEDSVGLFRERFPCFKELGAVSGVEFTLVRKDGSTLRAAFDGRIGRGSDGHFERTHCIMYDVTARRKAEEAQAAAVRRLRAMVEHLPAGAIFIQGEEIFFNRQVEEITGYRLDEIPTLEAWFEVLFGSEAAVQRARYLEDRTGAMPAPRRVAIRHKDGRTRCVEVAGSASAEAEVWLMQDVTERRFAEETLQSLVALSAHLTGREYFESLPAWLCARFGADIAVVAELENGDRARTLAMQADGRPVHDYIYMLTGTPCENVTDKGYCHYPHGVRELFPRSPELARLNIEGYAGLPLRDAAGRVLGVICIMSRDKLVLPRQAEDILKLVAARAGAELTRLRAEDALKESEARFRDLYNRTPVMMHSVDASGRLVQASDYWLEKMGFSREETLGRQSWEFMDEASRRRAVEVNMPRFFAEGSCRDLEYTFLTRGGQAFDVLLSAVAMRDEAGRFTHSMAVLVDVTGQNRTRRELERELAVNRSLTAIATALTRPGSTLAEVSGAVLGEAMALTGSAHGFAGSIDPHSRDMVSHTLTAMMGGDACRIDGQDIVFHRGPDGYPGLWGHPLNTRRAFFSNDPGGHPAAAGLPSGHLPLTRFLAAPAILEDELVGIIALANAGTDYRQADLDAVARLAQLYALAVARTRAEAALLESRRRAEAASQAKSEFLANMSHEIRTPLNGIFGMIELAKGSAFEPEQMEFLDTALDSGRRLLTILNDILDLSRIEAGRLTISREPLDLSALLASVADIFAAEARKKELEFHWELDPRLPSWLSGDEGRIRQVLFNLLGNAVKFTPAGCIELGAWRLPGQAPDGALHVLFLVSDTGIGIPADRQAEIFEPFTQVDGSMRRRHGGAGLGLSIARRLVTLMGGEVAMDSTPGQGTSVAFALALHPAATPETAPRAETGEGCPRGGLSILLAEDDRVNRLATGRLLEKLGHRVLAVDNGRQALAALAEVAFDLVILDVQMPELDGLETARLIRADPTLAGLPVVAMTAHAMSGDRERCLDAGMDDYLAKPVLRESLEEVISRLTRRPRGAAP